MLLKVNKLKFYILFFNQFRVSAEVFMNNFGYSFSEAYFSPKNKETTFELYDYL